jgi:hypothetical protein
MGEITHMYSIGETSSKFLYGPSRFLLVHCMNSCFLLVHSSSSNMFFKIAKRLFKGRREKIKLSASLEYVLLVHRNLCS